MRIIKFSMVLVGMISLVTSCSKDDEVDPGTPPDIPPLSTMVMNVENFTEGTTSQAFLDERVKSKLNWTGAALQVGFWNTILTLNLAIPVAAFGASINETPVYDSDRGLWVWTFEYNFVGRTYTSELTGEIIGDQVEWNMYISEEAGFQDVLWYTGIMQIDGSGGYWILSKNGNNPVEYLRIDWTIENEDVASIKYEVIESGAEEIGSYIEYGKMTGSEYNIFYNVYIANTQKSASIEWNSETGVGRVEYNDSGEYLCWDSNFDDVDCGI